MTTVSAKPVPRHTHLRRVVASASRFLHLYLSMVSFAVVLFFAATGITLNHPDWFAKQKTVVHHGVAPQTMLGTSAAGEAKIDKLGLVEMLRAQGIHGAVSDFRVDETQIEISFKAPGYSADTFVERASGRYDATETRNGLVAVLNDLHKGRDSGAAWSVVIDVAGGLLVLVSVTGLTLLWFMHKRRTSGLLLVAVGAVVCVLMYRLFVP